MDGWVDSSAVVRNMGCESSLSSLTERSPELGALHTWSHSGLTATL